MVEIDLELLPMLIHPLTTRRENGETVVAARIELERPPYNVPSTLWFRFPEAQADLMSERFDGFAVALLYLAMARGEKIELRDTLSPRLAYGLTEFVRLQTLLEPHKYHAIEIRADGYAAAGSKGNKIACTFTGGVDSFFTLWSHLPQNEAYAGNGVDCALFVHGMDIGLESAETFELCRAAYGEMVARRGIRLLTARTNVRAFDVGGDWSPAVYAALTGIGHLMGGGLARFYLSPGGAYDDYLDVTISVLQKALLSSETLEVIADGARFNRIEKIKVLAEVPETYGLLRVCFTEPNGLQNCCKCDKCLDTMALLEMLGALPRYKTFPLPLNRARLRGTNAPSDFRSLPFSILKVAVARGRYDLSFDYVVKLLRNYSRWGGKWARMRVGEGRGGRGEG